MAQQGIEMVRYADDFVILCRSEAEAQQALALVQQWTAQAGLTLHPEKTRIVAATQHGGFDFLGYHFERGYKWPRKKSLKKFKDKLRVLTKRNNGQSLEVIIARVNTVTRGWFGYFKHSHYTTFPRLDKWLRMRLRSLLRKRRKRRGRARLPDNQRWPNAFFAAQGLFSLVTAQGAASSILSEVTHQPESRMREIRTSGSEGGGAKPIVSPYPYLQSAKQLTVTSTVLDNARA